MSLRIHGFWAQGNDIKKSKNMYKGKGKQGKQRGEKKVIVYSNSLSQSVFFFASRSFKH